MFIRPRIIPVLLLNNRDLVKTMQFSQQNYLGDPINAVKIFNRKGIDELIVLDIIARKENQTPDFEFLEYIASEAFMPLSYGGGITNIKQVKKILSIGFEKVIFNTELVNNPNLIEAVANFAGSQSTVVSIDVKMVNDKYKCVVRDGTQVTSYDPVYLAKFAESLGVGEIFLNSIDRDGMMSGYDLELIKSVVDAVSIPVIACGGAGKTEDFKIVLQEGKAHAAAGGSIFVYYGRLKAVLITVPTEKELMNLGIYNK